MARYESKARAIVDYAGILGVATLRGPTGATLASSGLPPEIVANYGLKLSPRVPGALCSTPTTHELKAGGYTLTIVVSPGISPLAVKTRLAACMRLLRALGDAPIEALPPTRSGGPGPANAEIRVWAPGTSPRHRSS